MNEVEIRTVDKEYVILRSGRGLASTKDCIWSVRTEKGYYVATTVLVGNEITARIEKSDDERLLQELNFVSGQLLYSLLKWEAENE